LCDRLELVCATDSLYSPHLGVLLRSIARTNAERQIRVHVLHDDVSVSLQARIARCAPTFEIRWYAVSDHMALQLPPLLHISRATYLRLTMTEVLNPAIKRVLFLDVDMIVNGDLKPLWDTDLNGMPCAAVADPGVSPGGFAHKYGLPSTGGYFNAGVMLIDMDRFRDRNVLQNALDLLDGGGEQYEFADQDVLNILLWQQWHALDPTWNFQRKFLYDGFSAWRRLAPQKRTAPTIVHFTEAQKPWKRSEWHPYAWLYLRNLWDTPFRAEVLRAADIGPSIWCRWWLRSIMKRPIIFYKREFRLRDHLPWATSIKRLIKGASGAGI
jgi:lipopolysaccharide biosynthesis glycosyltransferase